MAARLFRIGTQRLLLGSTLSGSGLAILGGDTPVDPGDPGGGVGVLPTLIAASSNAVSTRINTTVLKPAGTVAGKRIFVWFQQSGSGAAVSFGGTHGFTQIGEVGRVGDGSFRITTTLFTKVCGADEPASWVFEHASRSMSATCRSFNNADYYKVYPGWDGNATQARIVGIKNLVDNALRASAMGRWDTGTTGTPSFMSEVYADNAFKLYEGEIDAGDIVTKTFNNGNSSAAPSTILSVVASSIPLPASYYNPADYPSASNTGVSGTLTNQSGTIVTTANGQVIQNINLTGMIGIRHNNVTIRNCRIDCVGNTWGIDGQYTGMPTGAIIEDCEIYASSGDTNSAILTTTNCIVRRCNISRCSNGIMVGDGGGNIYDNYIHDLASANADPHFDGIQGGGDWTGLTINHNRVESFDTSCILLQCEFGPYTGVTISNNLLMSVNTGVASFLYLRGNKAGDVGVVSVTNNIMIGSAYAGVADLTFGPTSLTWTGNIDEQGQLRDP